MLKTVFFMKDHRKCFRQGDLFQFRPGINLLVGEQGCGKSTLLDLIRNSKENKGVIALVADPIQVTYFDFEKGNPRILSYMMDGPMGNLQMASLFSSHGQSVNAVLGGLDSKDGILFLLDEPDMSLSVRSCYRLVKLMHRAAERKCQVIAAVHNPILIAGVPEVYSLEHRKWMKSAEFIASHASE
jgi:predicted ATPase